MVLDKVHDNHRSAHQEGCRETMMHFALKFLVDDPLFDEEQPYGALWCRAEARRKGTAKAHQLLVSRATRSGSRLPVAELSRRASRSYPCTTHGSVPDSTCPLHLSMLTLCKVNMSVVKCILNLSSL